MSPPKIEKRLPWAQNKIKKKRNQTISPKPPQKIFFPNPFKKIKRKTLLKKKRKAKNKALKPSWKRGGTFFEKEINKRGPPRSPTQKTFRFQKILYPLRPVVFPLSAPLEKG